MSEKENNEQVYYVATLYTGEESHIYHTRNTCHQLSTAKAGYITTHDVSGKKPCYWCARTKTTKTGKVLLNGDFPKRVEIPIWVSSDGTEFGQEIDALRHEVDILRRQVRR